ncbi:LOW QUALITY PROTEIN: transcription factor 7 [Camelus ferus]|uniref:Transcription factor 7 n=1 Tax=Camelus ferus TaxID=419612 RepID=A0A8B8SR48_CAMFR|nr:LOW QUALITY PROTEIN: transcription factor 7 [Camelus ferus]
MFGPASSPSGSARRPRPAPAARPGGVSPRSACRAPGSEVGTPGSPPPGPAPRPTPPRPAPPRAERTMPQLDSGGGGAGGGDDLGAPDELLAFQDEGEEPDNKSQDSATGPERDLAELKSSLVNESEGAAGGAGVPGEGAGARGEAEVGAEALGREHTSQRLFPDKLTESLEDGLKAPECSSGMYKDTVYSAFNLLMHYPPPSGAGQHPQPQPPLHNKASQPSHGVPQLSPLYEHFSSPHPTPAPADISQKQGVHRPLQTPDLSGFYSLTSGSMGQLPHTVSWFTHPSLMLGSGVPGHPAAIPHPAIVPPSGKQELQPYDRSLKTQAESKAEKEAKKPTIKKPLNAFMLYMKEMRAKVIAECTLKESAAINQILGRRWHALSREEQAKYYELARKERQLHMQLYPGWSARDNYGKKKRRSREKHQESNTDPGSPKKCRARFGLNQQTDWCGPCRRKKKCIRYLPGEGRCPSPVPSDDSALGCPGSPAPQDSPSYLLLPHFPTELLASPAEQHLHHQVSRPLSASQTLGPLRPLTATYRAQRYSNRSLRDRQPSVHRTHSLLQGSAL